MPIAQVRKTRPEIVIALDQLLDRYSDTQAAVRLNELGFRNWRREPFTYLMVRRVRREYKLRSRYERLRAQGLLTAQELAPRLRVCAATVSHWADRGILRREIHGGPHCLYVPPDMASFVPPAIGRPRKSSPKTVVPLNEQDAK